MSGDDLLKRMVRSPLARCRNCRRGSFIPVSPRRVIRRGRVREVNPFPEIAKVAIAHWHLRPPMYTTVCPQLSKRTPHPLEMPPGARLAGDRASRGANVARVCHPHQARHRPAVARGPRQPDCLATQATIPQRLAPPASLAPSGPAHQWSRGREVLGILFCLRERRYDCAIVEP